MADFTSLEELRDAVVGAPVAEEAPQREPQRDSLGRSYATGKRKDAVARVWIKPGNGKVTVNGKDMGVYFARPVLQMVIGQAFSRRRRRRRVRRDVHGQGRRPLGPGRRGQARHQPGADALRAERCARR